MFADASFTSDTSSIFKFVILGDVEIGIQEYAPIVFQHLRLMDSLRYEDLIK